MGPIGHWNEKSCFEFIMVREAVLDPQGSDNGSGVVVEAPGPPPYGDVIERRWG